MTLKWLVVVWIALLFIYLTLPLSELKKDKGKKDGGKKDDGGSQKSDCNKTTKEMLVNPCSHLELEVTYSDWPKVRCGVEIPFDEISARMEPKIVFATAKPDKAYTLIMIDPDAKHHTFPNYWLHWLVLNIKGKDLSTGNKFERVTTIAGYTPPSPPPDGGVHHIQFYCYEQKSDRLQPRKPEHRAQFDVMKFVNDLGLCGPPSAAFEFKIQAAKPG